jgi:hypothetical protein
LRGGKRPLHLCFLRTCQALQHRGYSPTCCLMARKHNAEFKYEIRSSIEQQNRVARESELSLFWRNRRTTEPEIERCGGEGEAVVTDDDKPPSRSRPVETSEGAMDEYLARQDAERAKTAKLKALRLAVEA